MRSCHHSRRAAIPCFPERRILARRSLEAVADRRVGTWTERRSAGVISYDDRSPIRLLRQTKSIKTTGSVDYGIPSVLGVKHLIWNNLLDEQRRKFGKVEQKVRFANA